MPRIIQSTLFSMLFIFVFYPLFPAQASELSTIDWIDWQRTRQLNQGLQNTSPLESGWHLVHQSAFGLSNQRARGRWIDHEVVVRASRTPSLTEIRQLQHDLDISSIRKLAQFWVIRSGTISAKALQEKLSNRQNYPWVKSTEPLFSFGSKGLVATNQPLLPNDPLFKPYQWNLPEIGMPEAWQVEKGSRQVKVAIVDSGVDLTHPDLKSHLIKGYNAIDPELPPQDTIGHGTHVAGIIAAAVNNVKGVAGLAWHTSIMPVKVLSAKGEGDAYHVAKGIVWAVDHQADVINLSLGDTHPSSMIEEAVNYAAAHHVVLVGAAGNNGRAEADYPASYPGVINVGASDPDGQLAVYSNYGPTVDLIAPGSHIASTFINGQYASLSGTSMASPHVAAVAALLKARHPDWTAIQIRNQILKTARPLLQSNQDKKKSRIAQTGYGMLNAMTALGDPSWPAIRYVSPGLLNWIRQL